jgi:hypothetical protein
MKQQLGSICLMQMAMLFVIANTSAPGQLRMFTATGQVIDSNSNVPSGATVQFGSNYRPGIYMVEAINNLMKTTQKLIKQ